MKKQMIASAAVLALMTGIGEAKRHVS